MKIKINKKISRNLIKEKITKTKIAGRACRKALATRLKNEEYNLERKLTPEERRDIINNFRFDLKEPCTWDPFWPLRTRVKSFEKEYNNLMPLVRGLSRDESEQGMRKVKASLDELIRIVGKFKQFKAFPGPVETEYLEEAHGLLINITKKFEDDYLSDYNFDIEEPDDIKPSDTDKVDDAEGEPLVQKQKRLKETTKRNNKSIILRIPKK